MSVYVCYIELGVGPSTLLDPLQATLFLCFWLWKRKENYSPSQTFGVPCVGFAQTVGTSLHHFFFVSCGLSDRVYLTTVAKVCHWTVSVWGRSPVNAQLDNGKLFISIYLFLDKSR